ncbi:hypothetical protein V2J09_007415 [Rumex salicifolius]
MEGKRKKDESGSSRRKGVSCSGETMSTRWQPSKEQIEILESVYMSGVKTPSAEQIQQITARLSAYGPIEGKNVFYWFQNTKARRRQKLKQDQRMANYLTRFYPPLMPNINVPSYVPPILPNGVVSDMAGYYYYPNYGGGDDQVKGAGGFAVERRVDGCREWPRECKTTLDLFPLHPAGAVGEGEGAEQDEYCYYCCASAAACRDVDGQEQGPPGFIDFFSTTTTTTAATHRD